MKTFATGEIVKKKQYQGQCFYSTHPEAPLLQ